MGRVAGARRRQQPKDQTETVHRGRNPRARSSHPECDVVVLIVPLILVTLWVLGAVSSLTMGGFLHIFLLAAICMMLPRLILGRKAAN
jgi:hypothetical protein